MHRTDLYLVELSSAGGSNGEQFVKEALTLEMLQWFVDTTDSHEVSQAFF